MQAPDDLSDFQTHKLTSLLLELSLCETLAIWEMKQEGTFNVAREWRRDFFEVAFRAGGQ